MGWPHAILLDFYGTVVEEDDPVISEICQVIHRTAAANGRLTSRIIGEYWSDIFSSMCVDSAGSAFLPQRELERRSLRRTIEHFRSTANEESLSSRLFMYWRKPPIFRDSTAFLNSIRRPVCIVSNIDRSDIDAAILHHGLAVDLVVTSEDVRAYKPRPEPFQLALDLLKLSPDQVLHVGDSLTGDVAGANALGIPVAWVNRKGRKRPSQSLVAYETSSLEAVARALT